MNATKFAVTRFKYPNGATSWRVDGRLQGLRIRKNFKTREEAAAEKSALELKALQLDKGMRAAPTTLSDDQLRAAEAVFHRLGDSPRPLSFYVDFALANYRKPEEQKPLAEGCAAYVAAKQRELDQDQLSVPMLARIDWELKRLVRHFGTCAVAELTSANLVS